ncbi:MAG: coenzyme F420-0:L-glutamate ligase, partial [Candidatus Bathyarchaeia archaeon]
MKGLRFRVVVVRTHYWRLGEDFLEEIAAAVKDHIEDGAIITISEKALSTAMGNILDESKIRPGRAARFIAKYWMRYVWGCFLGSICRLRVKNLRRIRNYPLMEGSIHKEAALQ